MHSYKLKPVRELNFSELNFGDMHSLHQRLTELLNGMQEVLDEGAPRIGIVSLLDRYVELTLHYFATEEALMLEFDYPEYESHKLMHDCSVERTFQVDRAALIQSSEKAQELVDGLSDWLTEHIRTDLDMAANIFRKPDLVKA